MKFGCPGEGGWRVRVKVGEAIISVSKMDEISLMYLDTLDDEVSLSAIIHLTYEKTVGNFFVYKGQVFYRNKLRSVVWYHYSTIHLPV